MIMAQCVGYMQCVGEHQASQHATATACHESQSIFYRSPLASHSHTITHSSHMSLLHHVVLCLVIVSHSARLSIASNCSSTVLAHAPMVSHFITVVHTITLMPSHHVRSTISPRDHHTMSCHTRRHIQCSAMHRGGLSLPQHLHTHHGIGTINGSAQSK
jgi:hypothetical protein